MEGKKTRPKKYPTPKKLEKACITYFDTTPRDEWRISGLCLHLGLTRETLLQYQRNPKYKATVEWAKLMIEDKYEAQLTKNNPTGSIFALKNFGWTDKVEQVIDVNAGASLTRIFEEISGDKF